MTLSDSYHAMLRECDDFRRFINRVQRMLDREEAERAEQAKLLPDQAQRISEIFADKDPQVFYTSMLVTLASMLDRHKSRVERLRGLRKLTEKERHGKNII